VAVKLTHRELSDFGFGCAFGFFESPVPLEDSFKLDPGGEPSGLLVFWETKEVSKSLLWIAFEI
jgi:hypothetical protein